MYTLNKLTYSLVGLYLVLTICMLLALGPFFGLQQLSVMVMIPSLFLISSIYLIKKRRISGSVELGLFVFFYFYALASIFYSENTTLFINNLSSLTGALMAGVIAATLSQEKSIQTFFHYGYITSILLLFLIMIIRGNFSLSNFSSVIDYRDRFLLNANAYSYLSVFANISMIYLYIRKKNLFNLILLLSLPALFIIIAFTTQSRSGLLFIAMVNMVYWFFINTSSTNSKYITLLKRLFYFIVGIVLIVTGYSVFESSRIKDRFIMSGTEADPREILLLEGWHTFQDHPFLGVGLGQVVRFTRSGQFTHNSYIEALAENGILGFILITSMLLYPGILSWKYLKRFPHDEILRTNILFFMVFLIYNNAYPFYKFPFSMMYFFLIVGLQEKYIRFKSEKYRT